MAKRQTRRSVSINRQLFEQIKGVTELENIAMSQYTEDALRSKMAGGTPVTSSKPELAELADGNLIELCGDSAQKWAEAFMAIAAKRGTDQMVDEDTLMGWFANAIETSTDVRNRRRRAQEAEDATAIAKDRMTASEAVYGFVAWLTTRSTITEMGASKECGILVPLIQRFLDENKLTPPRNDYHHNLTHPSWLPEDGARDQVVSAVVATDPAMAAMLDASATFAGDDPPPPVDEPRVVYDTDPNA